MTKLLLANNRCRLEGLSKKATTKIMERLSFREPNFYFSSAFQTGKWDGFTRFMTRPGNVFDTGLLPIVLEELKKLKEEVMVADMRTGNLVLEPIDEAFVFHSGKSLREYQDGSVNDVIMNKAYNIPFVRGVVNIATNGGKTVISEAIIHQILPHLTDGKQMLFLTHSKEIAYQSKTSIENDLGIKVGIIGDGQWEEELVTVALVPTLYKRMKEPQFKSLTKNVIAFVADECHHATATSWSNVIKKLDNAYIRIGLTGTIPKGDIDKHKLFGLIGPPVTKISNDFLIEQGFSAKPDCFFTEIKQPELDGVDYQTAYKECIVTNEYRNRIITQIAKMELEQDSNILILVERTEHGEILQKMIKALKMGNVEYTHGQKDTDYRKRVLADLKAGKIRVLIATSVLDEGVDADNINAVIYARGMESSRKLLQGIGRGLRKKKDGSGLAFYDFLDYTNEYLTNHTLTRYETVVSEGFEINKLEVKLEV